jgi:hypothetical protein
MSTEEIAAKAKMLAKQQDYAKEMAGINQGYAMDMANWSHNANKDMWDYTNYENQVAHLKAAADHVANELFKTMGELDIKQKQLLKDWIYQGIHAGVELLEGVTDLVKIKALLKAASKGIKEVIQKKHNKEGDGQWSETWIKEIFKE